MCPILVQFIKVKNLYFLVRLESISSYWKNIACVHIKSRILAFMKSFLWVYYIYTFIWKREMKWYTSSWKTSVIIVSYQPQESLNPFICGWKFIVFVTAIPKSSFEHFIFKSIITFKSWFIKMSSLGKVISACWSRWGSSRASVWKYQHKK